MYIFVPLINLMRYFVIFVMFSIIKHNSYHVMVHDWNKNILSYLILSYLIGVLRSTRFITAHYVSHFRRDCRGRFFILRLHYVPGGRGT